MTVEGDGVMFAEGGETFDEGGAALFELAVFEEGLVGGIDGEGTAVAIDEGVFATADAGGDVAEAEHGGDTEFAGEDGGMAGGAAAVGDESEDAFAVEDGGGGGGQVRGDNDGRFGEMEEVTFGGAPEEMVEDPPADIAEIGGAFAEVIVFERADGRGEFLGDLLVGGFAVEMLIPDEAMDFAEEAFVLEDEEVGIEDRSLVLAEDHDDLALDFEEVAPGGGDGVLESLDFAGDFVGGDFAAEDMACGVAEDDDASVGHPGGGGDAAIDPFTGRGTFDHGSRLPGVGEGWNRDCGWVLGSMGGAGAFGGCGFADHAGDLGAGDFDEVTFGEGEASSAPEGDDPGDAEATFAEVDGDEFRGGGIDGDGPGRDEGGAEAVSGERDGLGGSTGFALHVEADLVCPEEVVDVAPGDGLEAGNDDGLGADGIERGGGEFGPGMIWKDGEDEFLGEEGFCGEAFVGFAGGAEDEIDATFFEEVDGIGFVDDFGAEEGAGFATADFGEDGREEGITEGCRGADAEAVGAPLTEAIHATASGFHFAEDPFCMGKELFTGLGEHHGLAHPVKKATTHVGFEGFDGV